uniref:Tubulin gamma chain-like n=1 Tax=Dermatophagoides pteronyssinus TaxID=6956 RepID=A0A6P6YA14_DERPT
MTHEILTIALGQCGNQIISDYWAKYLSFLNINADGTLDTENNKEDYKSCRYEVGLMEVGENRYRPRSLMFDLESRVISSILNGPNAEFYDPKSIWMGTEGAGAGNNWAVGYEQAQKNLETLSNMIDTELEMCNSAQAITICHSISGGTGSGMGSVLLELLRMKYPKILLQTYSVAPNTECGTSDVVVQPYNTVLTLDRLVHCADAVHLIQNECLDNISSDSKTKKMKPVNAQNEIIVNSMIGLLNSVLFPSYMDFTLVEILSPLIPIQKTHFLLDSFISMDPFNLKANKSERRAFIESFYRSKLFDNMNEFERVEDTLLKLIKEY